LTLSEDVRLVTLVGPAGVGKTRLALEAGNQMAASYPGGVSFVDLTSIHNPALVLTAIAQTLGIGRTQNRSLLERLEDHLGAREVLLILDNVEQVVAAAPQLADLLARCSGVTLLVTSREPLHLQWEHSIQIRPLPVPDPQHLPPLEELYRIPAVALFVQRVRAIDAQFGLSADSAPIIAELCVRLDGLPLAIELAAARMRLLSPQMILDRLDHRFSLLRWHAQDMPARQRTLHSAIGWSYDLLGEGEQRLFRHIGVFVSSFTLEAVEALEAALPSDAVDPLEVLDGISSLVDKSLVVVEPVGENEVRYRLLESVREYALEQLTICDECDRVREAHAAYFLEFAERGAPELGHAGQVDWFSRLERECDNLRAAVQWFGASSQTELQLRLLTATWYFCWTRGYMAEGTRCLKRALTHAHGIDPAVRARALSALAILLLSQGELAQAEPMLEEAQELAHAANDLPSVAQALTGLGLLAQRRRQWKQSARFLDEARACARGVEDAPGMAYALVHLGVTTLFEGNHDRAEQLLGEAEAAYQRLADLRNAHTTRAWLAYLAGSRGDMPRAAELWQPCIEFATHARDIRVLYHCANIAIWLMAERGDPEPMARLVGAQRALLQRTGFTPGTWGQTHSADAAEAIQARLTPEAFDAALTAGRLLTDQQLADLATSMLTSQAHSCGRVESHEHKRGSSLLSEREEEVLRLVAEGLSNKGIAKELIISPSTVNYHLTSVFNKLGVNTRAHAVAAAAQRQLL
jgi:non-specific serine/threonine protein kinase